MYKRRDAYALPRASRNYTRRFSTSHAIISFLKFVKGELKRQTHIRQLFYAERLRWKCVQTIDIIVDIVVDIVVDV